MQIAKDEFIPARRRREACRGTLTDDSDAAGLSGRRVQGWIQARCAYCFVEVPKIKNIHRALPQGGALLH